VRRLDWSRSVQEQIAAFSGVGISSSTTVVEKPNPGLLNPGVSSGITDPSTSNIQPVALIPYIGVMLTDLTFIHQGNKSYLNPSDPKPLWQMTVNMWKRYQQFNSLDVFIRVKQMSYTGLSRDEKVLRVFNGFRDFMDEEQQWAVFETIKSKM
jgi:hypothetical protein